MTFTKEDYADVSWKKIKIALLQVWITVVISALYNAAFESYSDHGVSQVVQFGRQDKLLQTNTNEYRSFRDATGGNHNNLPEELCPCISFRKIYFTMLSS